RLAGRAAPLIAQVAKRAKLVDAPSLQLTVELLHQTLQRRAFELQPQLANGAGEDLLELGLCLLEAGHRAIKSSIPGDIRLARWGYPIRQRPRTRGNLRKGQFPSRLCYRPE